MHQKYPKVCLKAFQWSSPDQSCSCPSNLLVSHIQFAARKIWDSDQNSQFMIRRVIKISEHWFETLAEPPQLINKKAGRYDIEGFKERLVASKLNWES